MDSQIQPWNNRAKVRGLWRGTGNENLRFIFVWENPNDKWILVNVESYLAANGACDAFAEGGFLSGTINSVWVQATLNVWEWWHHPPTLLPPQATQTQRVLSVVTHGGGFLSNLGGGTVESASANGLFDVRRALFSLPPQRGGGIRGRAGIFLRQYRWGLDPGPLRQRGLRGDVSGGGDGRFELKLNPALPYKCSELGILRPS